MDREVAIALLFLLLYILLPIVAFNPQLLPYVLVYVWLMPLLVWLIGRKRNPKN